MIRALFIALAAFCKAVVDTLMFHFETSVFAHNDPKWWNPNVSWQYKKYLPLTSYPIDAWHLFNSGMIVFMCVAVALRTKRLKWWWEVLIAGAIWNGTFNIAYNLILKTV
jgi:hypothetical protein